MLAEVIFKSLDKKYLKVDREFNTWWRKNVAYRGISDTTGNRSAYLGNGFYSAALSNKEMAMEYGEIFYAVHCRGLHPLKFNTTNEWEIYTQNHIYNYPKDADIEISIWMQALGYDGVEISGREYVRYTNTSLIKMFKTKEEVYNYWSRFIKINP